MYLKVIKPGKEVLFMVMEEKGVRFSSTRTLVEDKGPVRVLRKCVFHLQICQEPIILSTFKSYLQLLLLSSLWKPSPFLSNILTGIDLCLDKLGGAVPCFTHPYIPLWKAGNTWSTWQLSKIYKECCKGYIKHMARGQEFRTKASECPLTWLPPQ